MRTAFRTSGLALALLFCLSLAAQAADYETGVNAYAKKDYRTAVSNLLPLAASGDSRAQYSAGILYQEGHGVLQDKALAWFWFTKAEQNGHPRAVQARFQLESVMTPQELEQGRKYLSE